MEQEIVDYILQAQRHGLTDYEIKQNLLAVGWEAAVVEKNFAFAKAAQSQQVSPAYQMPADQYFGVLPQHQAQSGLSLQPEVSMTDNQFKQKPGLKKAPVLVAILAFLVLAGGAFAYYTVVNSSPTPEKIWQNYLLAKKILVYKNAYDLSYSYNQGGATSTPYNTSYGLSGKLYTNITDPSNPSGSQDLTLNFKMGDSASFSGGIKTLLLDKVVYADLGQLAASLPMGGSIPSGWIKIDLDSIKQLFDKYASSTKGFAFSQDQINKLTALNGKLKQIWNWQNIVSPTNFLAKEQLNGAPVYHLKNQINQEALIKALTDSLQVFAQAASTSPEQITPEQKAAISAVIKKFAIKKFDVWIGQKDSQLYKLDLTLAAPAPSDLSGSGAVSANPFGTVESGGRDAKRLAQVMEIKNSLELYKKDFGGYPGAQNGQPQGLVPAYVAALPTAPEPADGNCTDYYNGYWYKSTGDSKIVKGITVYPDYTLTFCLGSAAGGYAAGIGSMSSEGIQANIACPTTADKCVNPSAASGQDLPGEINKLNFSGELDFSLTYSDFGKLENLSAPTESTDILNLINGLVPGSVATTTTDSQTKTN